MKITKIFIVMSLLFTMTYAKDVTASVVKIVDGDTIKVKVLSTNKVINIRLANIDAPETYKLVKFWRDLYFIDVNRSKSSPKVFTQYDQYFMGSESKKYLKSILKKNTRVLIRTTTNEKSWGRLIGEVYKLPKNKNGLSINNRMVKNGFVVCTLPESCDKYEKSARKILKGLWRDQPIYMNRFKSLKRTY